MNKLGLKIGAGVVAVVVVVVAFVYLTRPVAQVVLVKRGKAADSRPASVNVQAEYSMDLKSEVAGRIIRSDLDPGKSFKKGDFLAQLDASALQLAKMTLTAPFDCTVAAVLARPGDILALDQPVATLISTSRTVEARISEEAFANIRIGQKAVVRFLTYGENQYPAKVLKILPTADPATQRYMVHLQVDIPPEKLVPGISGEAVIEVGEHDNALIVPRRAVFGTNLYAVRDGRVELRKVKIGYTSLNEVEILSGVQEGEPVIVEQLDRFQPGDHVRIAVLPQ